MEIGHYSDPTRPRIARRARRWVRETDLAVLTAPFLLLQIAGYLSRGMAIAIVLALAAVVLVPRVRREVHKAQRVIDEVRLEFGARSAETPQVRLVCGGA